MHGRAHAHQHHGRNRPDVFEGRNSRVYDFAARWLLRGVYRGLAADVASVAPEGGVVLDVGTGPGVLLVEIARRRPDLRLTGIDLSADMIAAAGRNLRKFGERADAQVADVTALPFEDGSFDLVVTSFSLHHWDDPEAAVPELARVLKPGGELRVYDFGSAPFQTLADAAAARSLIDAGEVRLTPVRTGLPFFRCVRYGIAIGG